VDKDRVFGSQKVLDAIAKQNIALLKADWTNQDPRITAELARFGQSAVPLNLLYLPGRDTPIVLPVFPSLTPETVLNYLAGDTSTNSAPSAKSD
jgi:thiol:disulfide interchange protein DsbD